jgi:hypothetical protein
MKTKTFLLLFLFLGIGLNQLSAQNGKNGSGTVRFDFPVVGKTFPVFCEGVVVDVLYSPTGWTCYATQHFVNGELTWYRDRPNSDVQMISVNTGEVFSPAASFDHWNLKNDSFVWSGVFIGEKGNHYSFKITFDTSTWEMIEINSKCHWK